MQVTFTELINGLKKKIFPLFPENHNKFQKRFGLGHFQQYFSNIVVVSFIGGGNRNTRRKPPTCHKSLTNVVSSTPRHERDSNSQL
jgi:hypothetical protein